MELVLCGQFCFGNLKSVFLLVVSGVAYQRCIPRRMKLVPQGAGVALRCVSGTKRKMRTGPVRVGTEE